MTGRFYVCSGYCETTISVQIAASPAPQISSIRFLRSDFFDQISSYSGNVRNSANVSDVDMSSKIFAARS